MTRASSAEGSPKAWKLLVAALVAAGTGLYVAGYLFLWSIGRPPLQATPLTPLQYGLRYGDRVVSFELDSPNVSSTEVRERVARGEPVDDLVPPAVAPAIRELGLYRGYTGPKQERT